MKRLGWVALVSVAFLLVFSIEASAQVTCGPLPKTFSNGVIANATEVNANNTALLNCLNSTRRVTTADTKAILQSLATTLEIPVQRLGFTTKGDVAPIFYLPSNAPCSLNAGAGDNGSQVQSADGKCWVAPFPSNGADVGQFGAKSDGATDDSAAILAAIAWAATNGGIVNFPSGQTNFASTLTIGNGSSSAISTKAGVVLRGSTPTMNFNLSAFGLTGKSPTILHYTGAGTAIACNGPSQSCSVQDMTLEASTSGGTTGILLTSSSFGDFRNLAVLDFQFGIKSTTISTLPGGVTSANSDNNAYRGLYVRIPTVNGAVGVTLDSGTNTCCNTDYTNMQSVALVFSTGGAATTSTGLLLKGTDSGYLSNFRFFTLPGGGGTTIKQVVLDYTGPTTNWPTGITMNAFDNAINAPGFLNTGSPNAGVVNWVSNLVHSNGGVEPQGLAGLYPDHATYVWTPTIAGLTTPGTLTYTGQQGIVDEHGRSVDVDFNVVWSAVSVAPTGEVAIQGLPVGNGTFGGTVGTCGVAPTIGFTNSAGYTQMAAYMLNGSSTIHLVENGSGQTFQAVGWSRFAAAGQVIGHCHFAR
jgi:hypothetical protein